MFEISKTDIQEAIKDISDGTINWHMWHVLAWQEIRLRYRRSTFGPFWMTISTAIQVATMGVLVTHLFNHSFGKFLPYVSFNLILWMFISGVITEGANTFVSSSGYILQIKRPLLTYILQTIWRNMIHMGHNIIIFIVVAIIYQIIPSSYVVFTLISLPLCVLSLGWIALLLATLSARFRDVPVIVQNSFTVLMWLTPVIYYPEQLGELRFIADFNPLTHIMAIVREPFLGNEPTLTNWVVTIGFSSVGWIIAVLFFARFRKRVPYWL